MSRAMQILLGYELLRRANIMGQVSGYHPIKTLDPDSCRPSCGRRSKAAQIRKKAMNELGVPQAEAPEQVGFSSTRLEHTAAVIRRDVERRLIPGAVLAIARGGRLAYGAAFGFRDREAGVQMTPDAIFRIASMIKPITSIAAMILAEAGSLDIAAPVAEYLPELAEMTVGIERERATHTMTVQDLLCHTSGLTYAAFGESP
jgi:CubicO group peptidase (beta-lactamase class C family)